MAETLASNFKGAVKILRKGMLKNQILNLGLKEAEDS